MAKEKKQESKMDMQAMMEMYKKLATPGAPHKMLGEPGGNLDHQDQGMDGTR